MNVNTFVVLVFLVMCDTSLNKNVIVKYAAIGDGVSLILNKDVEPVLGKVKKHPKNPLFGQDKPWEVVIGNGYPKVIYDEEHEHRYRLWYDGYAVTNDFDLNKEAQRQPSERENAKVLYYAYSQDGVEWIKPNMGMYPINGSAANNILYKAAGVGIYDDIKHETNLTRRYKGFGEFTYADCKGVADSPDGIHWNNFRPLDINNRWDTHNNIFFDERMRRYVGITRGPHTPPLNIRTVARTITKGEEYKSFSQALVVEKELVPNQEPYAQLTFPFFNVYIGLVMIFHSPPGDSTVHCELAWSPDTITWHRVLPETEFIPRSPKPLYDSWTIYAARPHIVREANGEENIRLYYMGGDGPHGGDRKSFFSLATLPLDRFVGIKSASNNPAVVESVVLDCTGNMLIVSGDVEKGGFIKVAVKDAGDDYSFENCNGVETTATDQEVTWKAGDLSKFVGKVIVLQFQLSESSIFTFGFMDV